MRIAFQDRRFQPLTHSSAFANNNINLLQIYRSLRPLLFSMPAWPPSLEGMLRRMRTLAVVFQTFGLYQKRTGRSLHQGKGLEIAPCLKK